MQGPYKPSSTHNVVVPPIQDLLPPLTSSNFNYPSTDNQKVPTTSTDNSYQNEVEGTFPSSAPTVNFAANLHVPFTSGLVTPNQATGQISYDSQTGFNTQYQSNLATSSSNTNVASAPNKNAIAKNPSAPHGSSDFSAIHVTSGESNTTISSFAFSNSKPAKDTQVVNQKPINIQVDSGKYTGGFGGAPGILGEQKNPGYAVKPTSNPTFSAPQINNDHPALNSVHSQTPTNTPQQVALPNQDLQAPERPYNSGTTGQTNTNHGSFQFGTAYTTVPTQPPRPQSNDNGKYTGGFGGPPGIYSPYDNAQKSNKNAPNENSSISNQGLLK